MSAMPMDQFSRPAPRSPQSHDPRAGAARVVDIPAGRIPARRWLVLSLIVGTCLLLAGFMLRLFLYNGLTAIEVVMLLAYIVTLPWIAVGFWNAIIGFWLLSRHGDPAVAVTPQIQRAGPSDPVTARTAIVMPIRHERVSEAIRRFEAVQRDLARTAWADRFDYHVLSDSDDLAIASEEEAAVDAWRLRAPGVSISYRRREENIGYKAGNIAEFLRRRHQDYDFFLPLDADSAMGAEAVLRLVRIGQANPQIGILQGLIVGTPPHTLFAHVFQFGMRQVMRTFTLGAAWWQADCGPYWGHNALIRAKAFHDHCLLDPIPGTGVLSGDILSHDQVEAVLMRRAGFETRVYATEDDSFEDNPPTLPDFIKRELRWCTGNLQYFRLLGTPGLKPMSRLQLVMAILAYLNSAAWFIFIGLGAGMAGFGTQFAGVPVAEGLALFILVILMSLSPKLMGLLQVLLDPELSAAYGGRLRAGISGLLEAIFATLISPAVAFAVMLCVFRMCLGRRLGWAAQQRDRDRLSWREAAQSLWPQTLAGLGLTALLIATAPWAIPFTTPILLALVGAIPIAVLTAHPILTHAAKKAGLFSTPEETAVARGAPLHAVLAAA